MTRPEQIDWCPVMLDQAKHYRMPAAPTPSHPQMKPVNVSRLIETNQAKSLLREEVR